MAIVFRCDRCKKLSDDTRPPILRLGGPKPDKWAFLTSPKAVTADSTLLVCAGCKEDYRAWWERGSYEEATVED
jgi:hypothetical protein